MNKRKLQDGTEVLELELPVTLEVYTKCPEKWMLVDMETGEQYIGHIDPLAGPSNWRKLNA